MYILLRHRVINELSTSAFILILENFIISDSV